MQEVALRMMGGAVSTEEVFGLSQLTRTIETGGQEIKCVHVSHCREREEEGREKGREGEKEGGGEGEGGRERGRWGERGREIEKQRVDEGRWSGKCTRMFDIHWVVKCIGHVHVHVSTTHTCTYNSHWLQARAFIVQSLSEKDGVFVAVMFQGIPYRRLQTGIQTL